jgi:hypothetical protein
MRPRDANALDQPLHRQDAGNCPVPRVMCPTALPKVTPCVARRPDNDKRSKGVWVVGCETVVLDGFL